jgi:hypothetical protein
VIVIYYIVDVRRWRMKAVMLFFLPFRKGFQVIPKFRMENNFNDILLFLWRRKISKGLVEVYGSLGVNKRSFHDVMVYRKSRKRSIQKSFSIPLDCFTIFRDQVALDECSTCWIRFLLCRIKGSFYDKKRKIKKIKFSFST